MAAKEVSDSSVKMNKSPGSTSNSNGEVVAESNILAENLDSGDNNDTRQEPQPTRMESFLSITKSLIVRALIIYFITSFFRRPQTAPQTEITSDGRAGPPLAKVPAYNIFENGTIYDFYMYISEKEEFNDFENDKLLFWKQKGLTYGDWYSGPEGDGSYTHSSKFVPSETLKNNGSIFLHVYVTKSGRSPNPRSGSLYAGQQMSYNVRQLNKFKKQRFLRTHNLLTGETALTAEQIKIAESVKVEIVSHWHPNLTVNIVTDQTQWIRGTVPPPLDEYIEFLPTGDKYKPVLYMNDFWNMQRDYQPINTSLESLELRVTLQPLSLFKWQLYSAQAMRNKWSAMSFLGDEEEEDDQDSLKEALLETSPYLLGLTMLVSILHSVFELLAFKNDIQFWNNRKSLEGLSVRSVFFNVFQSLIVLLYVLDNDTNTIVRISCFVGLCIDVWKINKVVDISLNREDKLFGVFPKLKLTDKGSYVQSSTREYDIMAFKYLSWAVYPLLIGYGVYSLIYQEHKSWYSWVLSMLYGFLLTFGFIMMTPQLFINYKLKSVAHLPWRMMTYKALNTFIDDIFAFVIKMPTMYRIGCFRDDIVFFIFLYQKFIYKTDPTRVNEFGFSAEMEEEAARNKIENNSSGGDNLAINNGTASDKKND